jgi:osmotically inducible protein OsmC
MALEKVLYTATATATGGRTGTATSSDGKLKVDLATPRELGGAGGDGTNPEQMFAAGYAACFIGAMRAVGGRRLKVPPDDVAIDRRRGHRPDPGRRIGIAGAPCASACRAWSAAAEGPGAAAHQVCPYSNATRGNIDVTLTVA